MSDVLWAVDQAGRFLGGFSPDAVPEGASIVPTPPVDARQVWSGSAWSTAPAIPARKLRKSLLVRRMTPAENAARRAFLALPGNEDTADLWASATELRVDDALILGAAAAIGMSEARRVELLQPPTSAEIEADQA
jgi:hypothetical protein